MKSTDKEYKDLFRAEALEQVEELNRLLTALEKKPGDMPIVHAIFRITHTLKGNASGMGYAAIATMGHLLEDLFAEVRDKTIALDEQIFSTVFKSIDTLTELVNALETDQEVKYRGIKTKLEVLMKRAVKQGTIDDTPPSVEPITELALKEPTSVFAGEQSEESDETDRDTPDMKASFSDLVQVPVKKLDNLLTLVGELIIEKDRILATHTGLNGSNEYSRLSRISSDLQYSVMDVRLVQVGFLFNKFHRVVRDAASQEKKNVRLKIEGNDTEIDRNVLQVISDSLIHLIRNAVGHGIETEEARVAAGKPQEGTIVLSARNESDAVLIEIRDDGGGLNTSRIFDKAVQKGLIAAGDDQNMTTDEINQLIFEPGFSTVDQITSISGRGVGMDVVRKTLDSIGGTIKLISETGKGTCIQLSLPSSMAVKSCLLFEEGLQVYAIPLIYTECVVSLYASDIHKAGGGLIANHLNKNIAIVFLKDLFDQEVREKQQEKNVLQHSYEHLHPEHKVQVVVVTMNNRTIGLVVDKLLQQKEIVEKPLMKPFDHIRFVSGVSILGSGEVCLVLNIAMITTQVFTSVINRISKSSQAAL